jgi:hypothetical protein
MKRFVIHASAVALACAGVLGLVSPPVHAQFTFFDPAVYAEAVIQVEQLIKEYEFLVNQAKRLPGNLAQRYHALTPAWTPHDLTSVTYAQGILRGLNAGDPTGAGYLGMTDSPGSFWDIAGLVPDALRGSLSNQYGNVEFADAVATSGIDRVGQMRGSAIADLQVIDNMEADAASSDDSFQTQTAILNKINSANVLGLRIAAQNQELLGDTLEQLLVDNKRKRDADTRLMNAIVNQWRYGPSYGADLYSRTAANIDRWHPF